MPVAHSGWCPTLEPRPGQSRAQPAAPPAPALRAVGQNVVHQYMGRRVCNHAWAEGCAPRQGQKGVPWCADTCTHQLRACATQCINMPLPTRSSHLPDCTRTSQLCPGNLAAALGGPARTAPGQASRMAAPHRQCMALGASTTATSPRRARAASTAGSGGKAESTSRARLPAARATVMRMGNDDQREASWPSIVHRPGPRGTGSGLVRRKPGIGASSGCDTGRRRQWSRLVAAARGDGRRKKVWARGSSHWVASHVVKRVGWTSAC